MPKKEMTKREEEMYGSLRETGEIPCNRQSISYAAAKKKFEEVVGENPPEQKGKRVLLDDHIEEQDPLSRVKQLTKSGVVHEQSSSGPKLLFAEDYSPEVIEAIKRGEKKEKIF